MSLSFQDSLNSIATYADVPSTVADTSTWDTDNRYRQFTSLDDSETSIISAAKEITLKGDQLNLSQESNSQYIPFEMNRKYDGIDLAEGTISIHYNNAAGEHLVDEPVNVKYSTDKIRFGWLIGAGATATPGNITFEIHVYGEIIDSQKNTYGYAWKTKANNTLKVIESICSDPDTPYEIDETWWEATIQKAVEDIAKANVDDIVQNAVNDSLKTYTDAAQASAAQAAQSAAEAAASAEEAKNNTVEGVMDEVNKVHYTKEEIDTTFNNYYNKAEVDAAIAKINSFTSKIVSSVDEIAEAGILYLIKDPSAAGADLYKEYLYIDGQGATLIGDTSIDLSSYAKTTDVEALIGDLGEYGSVVDYISSVDISDKLTEYYTKEEVDTSFSDYYTKAEVDEAIGDIDLSEIDETYAKKETVDTLSENVSTLNGTVVELQTTVNSIDTSPRLTYDVAYNDPDDPEVGENVFVFYEIEKEGTDEETREAKKKFTIVGGGGGSSSGSVLKIGYITTSPYVVTTNDSAIIKFSFSGTDSSGDQITQGNATWKINGKTVATTNVYAGDNEFDITSYLTLGTQKVVLSITDEAGSLVTKTWQVQKIEVKLASSFSDTTTYPLAPVSFTYTPYGAIAKTIHFKLDGEELGTVNTTASGVLLDYTIPQQTHGSHLLEVYMTATVNNNKIESNHILKDIIWYDENSDVPVIGTTYQDFTARQYDATNITYTVYDPSTESPTVSIAVDGEIITTQKLDKATNTYSYKSSEVGDHTITITCGATVKTLHATITKLDIDVAPVTAGLVFDFNPSGKSNADADRLWTNGTYSMTVSDNFDWVNGGYQIDDSGDQYFCIKAGTTADIDYKLFADDARRNGKEFKLIFKTTNVANPDAEFLSCIDNTTATNHIGITMAAQEANIYGSAGSLSLPYSEDDIIEFEFNISKDTEDIPMVMGYEDGVSTRPMVYDSSYNFTQNAPKTITLGSPDCDLLIYRFKVYNTSLTAKSILNNFIADARNAEEMISRYDRNQIYDENQSLTPETLAEACPWLRIYKVSAPYFTNNKSDKVPNTTIQQIYKNGDPVLDNWTCYNAQHSGQGTSSNNYGAAGRNLDFIMNKSGIEGQKPYFIMGDETQAETITLSRTSVPVAYLNAKVNIASSNNMTNAMLTNRYNEFEPWQRPFVRPDGTNTDYIKDTMEFYNCVIFVQETDPTTDSLGNYTAHREFNDTDYHFYAIGNIGDSKKTDNTRLTDPDDKYECCIEVMDIELPLSAFPTDTMINAMGYTEDDTGRKTYTWATDENLDILYELKDGEYKLTEDTTVDLSKTYYVDILEHDDFSEDYTYGWRYISDEDDTEVVDYCKQKWIDAYRFLTTASDEDFKAKFNDYFVQDTVLYFYLFTLRYTMVDNRAKNLFFHYGKTGETDTLGEPIRKWDLAWGYDFDTALGLNNYGVQAYRYGLEDTDVDEKGTEIFRQMDSQFFKRIRDNFATELKQMYQTLESKNAWQAASFISQADDWQSEFPEELWRLDIERKYIRTYNSSFINGAGDAQFLTNMSNGKMKYQRRQWERNQEKYMASKYQTSLASSDSVNLRCTTSFSDADTLVVKPSYTFALTPYSYMYLTVQYRSGETVSMRAEPNKIYTLSPASADFSGDIIKVYSSSSLRSLGDLSAFYMTTFEATQAEKIQELIIGNATEGYDNAFLNSLTTGANYLLETLNIENVSGLTTSIDLSKLNNLKTFKAKGSGITGITFADGGLISLAELPAVSSMTLRNLSYLESLDIESLELLTSLLVENCNNLDVLALVNAATALERVRLTGINWTLADTTFLERLYELKGYDKNGYNIDRAVLAGSIEVPSIREHDLALYKEAWPDLEITYSTLIPQYKVSFLNEDGTVLEVQYITAGEDAEDPATRDENPIIPTQPSTIQYDFTFAGWDKSLSSVFSDRVITATYTSTLRSYTIKYVSKGTTLQTSTAKYGEYVQYEGKTPTYTAEESGYTFYLFKGWDKSGYVDGDKTVTAEYDSFRCTDNSSFNGKTFSELTPVEIYAMIKRGLATSSNGLVNIKDAYTITLGNDIDYTDIESQTIISTPETFDGTRSLDTGIKLFEEDKDFVLAIDYMFDTDTSANSVLAQCYQINGRTGFQLQSNNNSNVDLIWGTQQVNSLTSLGKREILVLRHKKGEPSIQVYNSYLDGDEIQIETSTANEVPFGNKNLLFGSSSTDGGAVHSQAKGTVYWAKIWFSDLGDEICSSLAAWPHESLTLEVCSFNGYPLADDNQTDCAFSLFASHLLSRSFQWNNAQLIEGGWAESGLNKKLNSRLYPAFPQQFRSLLQQVVINSWDGSSDTNSISTSNCYIAIPAVAEVDSTRYDGSYKNETAVNCIIPYLTSNASRQRTKTDSETPLQYWLRSPYTANPTYNYVHVVRDTGSVGSAVPSATYGVAILISF